MSTTAPGHADIQVPGGLRDRLRAATADAHAGLDARLASFDLKQRPDYRHFLEASGAALMPLEAALVESDVMRIFPDWPERSRRSAILADLAMIGGTPPRSGIPERLDFSGVLGTMYVLEGSRLGARFLLNEVSRSTDPTIAQATAYLRHGAGLKLWPSFLAALDRHAPALTDEAGALASARRAFELFDQAMATMGRPGPRPAAELSAE